MRLLLPLSNWYFTKKALPYWCVLAFDCIVVYLAGLIGFYLELGGLNLALHFWPVAAVMVGSTILFALFFHLFHTYYGIVRYTSFVDLQRVVYANACGSLATAALCCVLADCLFPNSQSDLFRFHGFLGTFIHFLVATVVIWCVRLTVKSMFESFRIDDAIPVAIYGTKAGGIALANSIMSVKNKKFRLVTFISDGEEMRHVRLLGKRILMNGPGIADELRKLNVRTVLISPLKSEVFRNNTQMLDELATSEFNIWMMPAEQEWDGKSSLTYNQLHEVEIEDLLPRDKIEVDLNAIGSLLRGKKILITGAAGSIGSEMVRQVALFDPAEMILIDQAETPMHDIRLLMMRQFSHIKNETIVTSIANQEHMEMIFAAHRPDYVFHAAAYKHVPMMEDNPGIAVQNNIYGTRVIADLAVKYGTKKFVMISTDKAVNPTNVMGCSKRICEIYCQSLNKAIAEGKVKGETQFVTTRFGNVLGSNGSVIPIFKEQIKKGGPITVTHPDIIRYFMLIPEACRLVLEAGTMGNGGEIFVFDMGQPVKIVDLAKRMIKLSGASNIEIKFSGLRPGEKLYEELLSTKENTKPTHHPKIMVAKVREYDYDTACQNEERLLKASKSFDDMAIVKIMKEIVPEFKSRVSKYEVLDK